MIIGIGIAVILIEIFFMLRINTTLIYSENGFSFIIKLPFFKIKLPKPAQAEKKAKKKPTPDYMKKIGGDLPKFNELVKLAMKTVGKFIRGIRIDELNADILIAGEDPFTVAMLYGGAASMFGIIFPIIENNFNIIKKNIRVNADFTKTVPTIYFLSKQSIAVWKLLSIIISFAYSFRVLQKTNRKKINALKAD